MAKLLRLRRGTDTQHTTFTGAEGEVTVNTTNDSLHVHDGTTAGGHELARADLSNLPAGTIDNADINNSAAIANSKLATSGVTAGTYGSSSAIPAITVNDRGIVTSATTSAIDSTAITNGTSNVSVAASGDITLTRDGSTKLSIVSDGISTGGNANVTGDITIGGEINMLGGTDAHKYLDVRLGSNAFTIRGTHAGDANHETLAQFERNAGASLFYDNVQKLITTSTGIDVTGTVDCDGLNVGGGGDLDINGGKIIGDSSNHVFIQGGNTITVYVSDSGNDSTGDGTSGSPVRTINRACELLPKVMGNQIFLIRIQGSSYTIDSNQMVRGFGFNGSNDISRWIELRGDTQTVTCNLRSWLQFYSVHGFRMTSINFVVESGYSGGLQFISCSEGRIYNNVSFTTNSTAGWSQRLGFVNSRRISWEANITATSSASAGLGGLVVISDKSQVDMSCTVSKSGSLFGNHGVSVCNGAEVRGNLDVNNFYSGITFGYNHYNAETGARGMLNGSNLTNNTFGIRLYNNSFVRKYSVSYSGNGTDQYTASNGGNFT